MRGTSRPITRRNLCSYLAAGAVFAPTLLIRGTAFAGLPPLPNLPATDAILLRPGDSHFNDYQAAFNARTMVTPQLRALCKTAKSVAVMIDWCRTNNLRFALRSGGHCYEGFSQSDSVVIDTRLIRSVAVGGSADAPHVEVGAGASLGRIYKEVAAKGFALPAGSCPTVGVSGHVLGGGYGYLARPLGLACDSLVSADLVDPDGHQIQANDSQNADLFWACRGGGGGSFGAATAFTFKLYPVRTVLVFRMVWDLAPDAAAKVMSDWQSWAPHTSPNINPLLLVSRGRNGVSLRCMGQSVGSLPELKRELKALSTSPRITSLSFIEAVNRLAGPDGWTYASAPMKGKSDYVTQPLTKEGIAAFMNEFSRRNNVTAICDAYGGAIWAKPSDATAFPHRAGTLFQIQYVTDWKNPNDASARLGNICELYKNLRSYMSGSAYVNYCDADLPNWAAAYWGPNLDRLKQIKAKFDPNNVFQHAQSVPLA